MTTTTSSSPTPVLKTGLGIGFMVLFVFLLGYGTYFALTYTKEDKVTKVTHNLQPQIKPELGAFQNGQYIEPAEMYKTYNGKDYKYYTVLRIKPNTSDNPVYMLGQGRYKLFPLEGNEHARTSLRTVDSQGKSFGWSEIAYSSFNSGVHFTTDKEVLIGIAIINY